MYEGVFVTEEKSLISFAILSTEWHEEKKDYLDMFIGPMSRFSTS